MNFTKIELNEGKKHKRIYNTYGSCNTKYKNWQAYSVLFRDI